MNKGYRIIRKNEAKKTAWSGGTVSELYIYPENADFRNRDFIFRISTATVDVEKSDFTLFEDYSRIIKTLDNELLLTHNDNEKVALSKYQPHVFYGGDKTTSSGKVNDHNFIMKRGVCYGDVMGMSIAKGSVIYPRKGNDPCDEVFEIVYCAKGRLIFKVNDEEHHIDQGDVLMIDHKTLGKDYLFSNEEDQLCDIVIATARINNHQSEK